MSELENAKVGDKLCVSLPHDVYAIETVDCITPTLVITRSHGFVKRTGRAQGYDAWYSTTAKLATIEDIENVRRESHRREIVSQCKSIDFNRLSVIQLDQILEIVQTGEL